MAKMATREAYGQTLAALAAENENILVLDADLSGSTKSGMVKKNNPNQHFNMGIAEGNMMGVAAGLAASGNIVFASSFAMFATGRAYEQIRNSIGYPRLNVKICASHAGITVGEDGASHQTFEDISLMRGIPNMIVVCPADGVEASKAIRAVAAYDGPCYVRLGRSAVETVYDEDMDFQIGKGNVLRAGKKVAIIACGIMVEQALAAYDMLKEKGYEPTVVDMHTIKPIDEELLVSLAENHDLFVTCEEHSVIGGLGSAVAEVLGKKAPRKIAMVGMQDTFGESGKPAQLLEKYGMTAKDIVKAVEENI
ncbi:MULTISPECIES: transketolase family protein [Bacillota]|jgi:transketolase|uniref:Transketolase family protein n=2 Tax=Amedibacillus TaxID=2749846 RepID=A0A7G9GJD1_9FIRM|nr:MULTISPECIES: transketolase family protein [Erysipelotrichaceae]QNM10913.1 transketolase family protein [[Eubacterium] hominis]MCH4285349.1 transketolase family protein [Amedibacillus hominis]RGB58406.1 transketolase family protein [Absiella sp. AM22-9]RGB63294.1 transketolase family protein [Absiella sp. AM10-20]RGB67124.1 transketolase family protein [Absiella sp. AM09-45]